MNIKNLSALFVISLGLGSFGAAAANLTIDMTGIKELKGQLLVAVYDSAESMASGSNAFNRQIIKVNKSEHSLTLNDVPAGEYGVMVFQDLNGDNKLGRNFVGIPSEPYGFSTNPNLMGAPEFKDIAFAVGSDDSRIQISLE
ncbi:DUF2141 domain-containing protein [Shewanella sp. JM162201]|uniref:DUF2141 domain-containing protein n=1 Tax=Shewanella jiangmenensis TaxID=2837387 RepID=A0ABS5V0I6_9GAMM|nr:DUF2141 domain-containing protein [Shewanella jiangmenensis]MBT1443992.1 DUF2141 domain-containing protein [Shewanella jiangmenensis]